MVIWNPPPNGSGRDDALLSNGVRTYTGVGGWKRGTHPTGFNFCLAQIHLEIHEVPPGNSYCWSKAPSRGLWRWKAVCPAGRQPRRSAHMVTDSDHLSQVAGCIANKYRIRNIRMTTARRVSIIIRDPLSVKWGQI